MSRQSFESFFAGLPPHAQKLNAAAIAEHKARMQADADRFDAMIRAKEAPKREGELHDAIRAILRNRDIPVICQRIDKPSQLEEGMPDFMLCVFDAESRPHPIAWEAKVRNEKPRPEQIAMHIRLERCGWDLRVIRTAGEALDHLDAVTGKEAA